MPLTPSTPFRLSAQEALLAAVQDGNERKIFRALAQGADPKVPIAETGETFLMRAVQRNHPAAVRALMPRSDPSQRDQAGLTAFLMAARASRLECLRVLAQDAQAPRDLDPAGYTALALHIHQGTPYAGVDTGVFDFLLPLCDVRQASRSGVTALMMLADHRTFEPACFNALLALSDPQAVRDDGINALMLAASPQAVEALLPVSDLSHLDRYGRDALSVQIASGNAQRIEMLLDAIPQPNPLSTVGALELLARVGPGREPLACLPRLVAREDPQSPSFQQAVHLAVQTKNWELAGALGDWLSDEQLDEVVDLGPWQTLPRVCARLAAREREALAQSLAQSPDPLWPASPSSGPAMAGKAVGDDELTTMGFDEAASPSTSQPSRAQFKRRNSRL